MAKKRDRRPSSEWEELVSAWRASGKSQREFAAERGLSVSTLASWSRKLGSASARRRKRSGSGPESTRTFSEVRVRPTVSVTPAVVQVTTPTGFVLRLTGEVDPASLRALLDEVARC